MLMQVWREDGRGGGAGRSLGLIVPNRRGGWEPWGAPVPGRRLSVMSVAVGQVAPDFTLVNQRRGRR